MLCSQAWQQAQVELVLHGVKGVVGSPCEGKEFDITFRWAGLTCLQADVQHLRCCMLCGFTAGPATCCLWYGGDYKLRCDHAASSTVTVS